LRLSGTIIPHPGGERRFGRVAQDRVAPDRERQPVATRRVAVGEFSTVVIVKVEALVRLPVARQEPLDPRGVGVVTVADDEHAGTLLDQADAAQD